MTMMKRYAECQALGYAAGREDASGIMTKTSSWRMGFIAFAEAFATAQEQSRDASSGEERYVMLSVSKSYDNWQASGGVTIF